MCRKPASTDYPASAPRCTGRTERIDDDGLDPTKPLLVALAIGDLTHDGARVDQNIERHATYREVLAQLRALTVHEHGKIKLVVARHAAARTSRGTRCLEGLAPNLD